MVVVHVPGVGWIDTSTNKLVNAPTNVNVITAKWNQDGETITVGFKNGKTSVADFTSVFRGDNYLAGATPGRGYGSPAEWADAMKARGVTEARYATDGYGQVRYCKPTTVQGMHIPHILDGDKFTGFIVPQMECGAYKYKHIEVSCDNGVRNVRETCKPIGCPENDGFPATELGEDAQAPCKDGAVGLRSRRCNLDGTWGPVRAGSCTQSTCAAQPPWPQLEVGKIATLPCDGGAVAEVGQMSRSCKIGGKWGQVNRTNCRRAACAAENDWPARRVGFQSVKPCPEGMRGMMFRDCTASGFGPVNTVQCVPVLPLPAPNQPPVAPPPLPSDIRPEPPSPIAPVPPASLTTSTQQFPLQPIVDPIVVGALAAAAALLLIAATTE